MLINLPCVSSRFAALGMVLSASVLGLLSAHAVSGPETVTGEQIFRLRCAVCHGAKGEGTKLYKKALIGVRTTGELKQFISQSMPPGPKKCTREDARKVADYLYNAFYSPVAQERDRPARVSLSRLTVRQYRNAVADLIGSFRAAARPDDKRGLHGEYFKARRFQANERVLERVDPEVRFDFGQAAPAADQFDPHQFSIRWDGSVLAPDTGEYDFIVRTEHSARLWVNDLRQPLIDAWVKSGHETEYRGTAYLLAGRAYPIRLEFSKSTQGVDDTNKQKDRPIPKASVALAWRRPKLTDEVIPQRCLVPSVAPESFAPTTPFPPDDKSIGYERGTSVSKAWDEATTNGALEAAGYVADHLRELSGAPDNAGDREQRIRAFCRQFVERAFRRPLTEDAAKLYVERQLKSAADLKSGVKRVVLLALQSPRFLYREMIYSAPDPYDVASRLSFGLWDSIPDQDLLKAAAAGELATREQVAKQAERMESDPRAWTKLREFLLQWLKVDQYPDIAKDPKRYPDFDRTAATDLRTSLELFLESTAWSDKSDYREMMLSDKLFLDGKLAKLYGAKLAADAPFEPVTTDTERAGVLTQPYMLACFAYVDNSSPIHRGVLIARNLLGRTLQPPPAAFTPLSASLHPEMTTRQRVALQTKPAACIGCHGVINPLGFTLEKFDAIGRERDKENGLPIDTSGSYRCAAGTEVRFSGVHDLAKYLATSDDAHAAFVQKLFQHLVKQPIRAYGPRTLPDLQRSFEAQGCSIRRLMVDIMAESALKR